MNSRERMVRTLLFKKPDRIPLIPGEGRKSTRERWHREGLPVGTEDITAYAYRCCGGKETLPRRGEGFPVSFRMIPRFEEKVIERRGRTQIVQDWKGNICEIGSEYSPEYLREPIDFVTRRWIRCPVESEKDWIDMRGRYDPDAQTRFPGDSEGARRRLRERDWFVAIEGIPGPFWQLREWLGFERLCTMFHDDPRLVREMISFWDDFVSRCLRNTFDAMVPDEIHFSEDMAFKDHAMISPSMVREFLSPTYKRWNTLARDAGCPIRAMDSDGFVGELIPLWLEAGFNACDPVEVAANNDIVEYRRKFGARLAFRGGVDKRAIARGGTALEAEMTRLQPVIEGGGYVPGCDHGIPADVSWGDFLHFVRLLAKATGWL